MILVLSAPMEPQEDHISVHETLPGGKLTGPMKLKHHQRVYVSHTCINVGFHCFTDLLTVITEVYVTLVYSVALICYCLT